MDGLRGQYQTGMLESFRTIGEHSRRIQDTDRQTQLIQERSLQQQAQNQALSEDYEALVAANKRLSEKVICTSTTCGNTPQQIALLAQKNQALKATSPHPSVPL